MILLLLSCVNYQTCEWESELYADTDWAGAPWTSYAAPWSSFQLQPRWSDPDFRPPLGTLEQIYVQTSVREKGPALFTSDYCPTTLRIPLYGELQSSDGVLQAASQPGQVASWFVFVRESGESWLDLGASTHTGNLVITDTMAQQLDDFDRLFVSLEARGDAGELLLGYERTFELEKATVLRNGALWMGQWSL